MKATKKMLLLGTVIVAGAFSIYAVQDENTDENQKERLVNDYNVYAIPVPDNLEFAGEPVPVESPDIYERMDRELLVNTYWQSNAFLLIKRANKYFPVIEPILAEYGVPDDLKYIAVIESGLTNAVSPAGARGFWQFMEPTGKELGLEINSNVDERYNLEKSTRAAAQYLKKSKERFGSWTLAAAAYNAGNYGISKQLDRQEVGDYYDLLLGEETGRYVFRILALKEILQDPKRFGFNFREKDLYHDVPSYKVKVDTAVTDFPAFARNFGINYKILKIHNPWLREAHLNNRSRKEYFIELPEKGYYSMMD
ncbi:murein transglycosylase [Salinimicrobium marinum]|uniref:Murein transglycosylase n=1 Tax=Salinimicrobium marinum TaxID=680283 RepID=A0A918SHE5_9FLAO|nr:lytic transglycosylase domain-containing protein [Salinimicrobium marinum]GHA41622.1 murein transglycosylase [Salinimicrobium marinum]